VKIIKLIKIMIVVFVVLAGVTIFFSYRAAQANNERFLAHEIRRAFTLSGHDFRIASLELTRLARAYIVMGLEPQLELYWEELLVTDRLGTVRQAFIANGASPFEMYLLDNAMAYQERLRAMDARAIAARTAGYYQLALDITYSPYFTAYGVAFVNLLYELIAATFIRTQGMVDEAESNGIIFGVLTFAAAVLFGLVGALGMSIILRSVKAAMQREREANELNQIYLDACPMFIEMWDDKANLIDCNERTREFFGLSDKSEFISRYSELAPEYQACGTKSVEKAAAMAEKALKEGTFQVEWMHKKLDGELLPVETTFVHLKRGEKDVVIGYNHDMRSIKAAMRKERAANEMAQIYLDACPMFTEVWDDELHLIECNKKAAEFFDLPGKSDFISRYSELSPEYQPCGMKSVEKSIVMAGIALKEGYVRLEWVHKKLNGELLPVETTLVRLRRGSKYVIIGYNHDLRMINAALQREREANEMNEILLSSAPYVMNIWDDSCNLVSTSGQAAEMFGLSSKEEFLKQFFHLAPVFQPCGAVSKERALENIRQVFRDGKRVQFEWMHKTIYDEPLPTEKTLVRFMRHGKYMVAAYTTDLRPIKAAEALTRKLLDNSPLFMEFWDENNNLLDCNKKMLETFGLDSTADFVERFFTFTPPCQPCGTPSREKNMEMIKCAIEKGRSRSEWMFILPNGEELPTEATWVRISHYGKLRIIVYSQDLRPIKQETQRMLDEIRLRKIAQDESQAKTRFLAHMSHEIRTPMNAVLGITEIQLQKESHPPETEEAFLRIQSSSNLLLTIINDILDLSKVEAGKMEIIPETYEVSSMLVDTVQLNIMRVGSKNIEFKLKVDESLPSHLIGDELRIKQILNNILSNAFKYTDEGTVTLSVGMESLEDTKAGSSIMLTLLVEDTGQGMAQDQIDKLFDIEFSRFNQHSNRHIEGTGLGMNIAHQLVNMMEGTIQVDSEVGQGSTFTVRIPQVLARDTRIGKEAAENLQNFEVTQKSLKRMSRMAITPMPYGRVLVVDDVESNLYVIKGFLMPYKIAIETVNSGYSAIEKIKNGEVYDLIFMDHMMPGMDGIEATGIIREMGYNHPVVALTANALKHASEIFLANGFSGFIPKPINLSQLNSFLLRFIRDKQPPEVLEAAEKQHPAAESSGNVLSSIQGSFLLDARQAIEIIESLVETLIREQGLDEKGLKSFVIQSHSMKSALHNIGKTELSKAAFVLETAGHSADMETIKVSAPRFLDKLREIIRDMSQKDTEYDEADEDTDLLKAQFSVIAQACEELDLDTANRAIDTMLQRRCSNRTKENIRGISTNLLYGDFDEAAALANQAAGTERIEQES